MTLWLDPDIQNRYAILGEIGRGGMGCVYKAHDTHLDSVVALKVILNHANTLNFQRFEREAKVLATLAHPNIIKIIDYGTFSDGRRYIVMPLIEGETLDKWIQSQDDKVESSVRVVKTLSQVLSYLHSKEIVHRDLKPENIMMSQEKGEPILLDFGLVRPDGVSAENLTTSGVAIGTYAYMPPEQANGTEVDSRSDVYGLGAILYHCLCGRPPIVSDAGYYEVLRQIFEDDPPPPSTFNDALPRSLSDFCLRCLSKNPSHRPQSADKFSKELELAWSNRGKSQKPKRAMIGVAIAVLVILLLSGMTWAIRQEEDSKPVTEVTLSLNGGLPGLRVYAEERLLGTIKADGTLNLSLKTGSTELSIVRETGERYQIPVTLKAGQEKSLKLGPRGLVNLKASQRFRVTIRNSKGEIARDEDGKEVLKRLLPISIELAFGQYTVEGTTRSRLKKERRHYDRKLIVKPGKKVSQRIAVGFETKLPMKDTWVEPVFTDLDGDGFQDFIFVGSIGQGHGQSFAISGYNGELLWRSSEHTSFWARPLIRNATNPPQIALAIRKDGQRRCALLDPKSGTISSLFNAPKGSPLQRNIGPVPFGEIDLSGRKKGLATAGDYSVWLFNQDLQLTATLKLDKRIKFHFKSKRMPTITDLDQDGRRNDLVIRLCDEIGESKKETVTREIRAYRDIDRKQEPEAYQGLKFDSDQDTRFQVFEEAGIVLIYSTNTKSRLVELQFVDAKTFKEINSATVRGSIIDVAESKTLKRIYVHSYFDRETRVRDGAVESRLTVFDQLGKKVGGRMTDSSSQSLAHVQTPKGTSRLLILSPELMRSRIAFGALVLISAESDLKELWRSRTFNQKPSFLTKDLDKDGRSEIIVQSGGKLLVESAPNK
ncbi:MAG: serine/threonine-protein kinase [Planctomycetota bacterium]|nr:serine/threonine-protein kinase [Planctomycetota bacterium]